MLNSGAIFSLLSLLGLFALLAPTAPALADIYPSPLQGVWGGRAEYAGHDSAATAKKACASYFKDPKAVDGDVIVFDGAKLRSYGGYADYVDDNVLVKEISRNRWRMVDRHYQDEEGGKRPGLRRVSYEALLAGEILTIRRGKEVSRYGRCSQSADVMPLKRGFYVQSKTACGDASNATLELFLGDRFRANCKRLSLTRKGQEYELQSVCSERGETIKATVYYMVHNTQEFTLRTKTNYGNVGPMKYRYCPQSSLPEPWRTNRIPELEQNPAGR